MTRHQPHHPGTHTESVKLRPMAERDQLLNDHVEEVERRQRASAVFTASWAVALAAEPEVRPARISVGWPKWIQRTQADSYPLIRGAAPFGLLARDMPPDEFRRRYHDRLERHADAIARDLAALRSTSDVPLALCCFEQRPEDCHRGQFSAWWEQRTGETIPEWPPPMAKMTLDPEEAA